MDEFMKLAVDQQADVFTKVIQPAEEAHGFTFVYPVLFDQWDATKQLTSKSGEYRGASLFEVILAISHSPRAPFSRPLRNGNKWLRRRPPQRRRPVRR